MVIISKAIVREFSARYPDAEGALVNWYELCENANWSNFNEMRNTFNSVDAVGNDRYVFNIKGNKYRLVALIIFKVRTIFIAFVGTHSEYDKIDVSTISIRK